MKPSRAGRVVFSVAGRRRLQQRDRRGLASLNRAGAYFKIASLNQLFIQLTVAQSVEQQSSNQKMVGSVPASAVEFLSKK